MRFVSTTAALVASSCLVVTGCAHERTAWPPTAADVQRINEAAWENNWFRVEYVKPIPSPDPRIEGPRGIASVDDDEIGFAVAGGGTSELPSRLVTGVTVKDRGRGALVGTGIGAAAGAAELGAWYLLKNQSSCQEPYVGLDRDVCRRRTFFIGSAVAMVVVGALFGYLISARRTFHFGLYR